MSVMPVKPIHPSAALLIADGPERVCQDCGMWIKVGQARFQFDNSHSIHARTEDCIEGHGE